MLFSGSCFYRGGVLMPVRILYYHVFVSRHICNYFGHGAEAIEFVRGGVLVRLLERYD